MKTRLLLSISIFVISIVLSCGKKDDTNPTTNEHYASMSDFFAKNGVPTQLFTLSASSGGLIIGSQGTKITFPAYSFKHLNGSIVTGNVSVFLREVYKKSDMLLSDVPTIDSIRPLNSGGMFELTVLQNNETLFMANQQSYTAEMPSANPDPTMIPFFGGTNAAGNVVWRLADTTINNIDSAAWGVTNYYANLLAEATGYVWTSNWLGMCNSDQNYFNVTETTLTLHGTNSAATYETQVFLVFDGGTMIHVYNNNLNDFPYQYAPIGYHATVVAVGVQDSSLFSSFTPITISNNQTVDFTLQPTTTDDFKAALDLLN